MASEIKPGMNPVDLSLIPLLTAPQPLRCLMNTEVSAFDHPHQLGGPATHPITDLPGRLAALLLLAGKGHARRRALPDGPAGP